MLAWTTSSMMLVSRFPGMNPAPMPWILWGPGLPPEMTGDSAGSTATICACVAAHVRRQPFTVLPSCEKMRQSPEELINKTLPLNIVDQSEDVP